MVQKGKDEPGYISRILVCTSQNQMAHRFWSSVLISALTKALPCFFDIRYLFSAWVGMLWCFVYFAWDYSIYIIMNPLMILLLPLISALQMANEVIPTPEYSHRLYSLPC
jgi:hypothetical protein